MLTGKWADETGINANGVTKDEEPKTLFTSLAEDGLIIIASDHGGFGTTHGNESIAERMIFVVMNKAYDG